MKETFYLLTLICFGTAYGYSRFKREIPNGYGVNHPCPGKGHWDAVGHMNGGYTPQKNVFGQDFRDGGKRWTVELCQKDSDGDGLTNGEELGDPQCKWSPRDPPPGPVKGHPGFCEPDRQKCDSGMTHDECPNPRARGRGRGSSRTPPRTLPPGANDHPQTNLQKNIDQGLPPFGMGRGQEMSFGRSAGFGSSPGRFGMDSGGFEGGFGQDSRGSSFGFVGSGPQSFQPPARPGLTSFPGSFGSDSFGLQGMSRDFGASDGSATGFSGGRGDFPMSQSQGFDRFRTSLDQRAIQGMGSPGSGPSFTSSMSQFDIDRSVRARMDRERSRLGGSADLSGIGQRGMSSGGMTPFVAGPSGMDQIGGTGMDTMSGAGMGTMGGVRMGPVGGAGMGTMGGPGTGSMGSAGMGTMGGPGMGPGFSGPYPPFMTMDGTSMSGPSFGGGMPMGGPAGMSTGAGGGMPMGGPAGMSTGAGGMMMRTSFSRF